MKHHNPASRIVPLLSAALLLAAGSANAQFNYVTNSANTITITGYAGSDPVVTIPSTLGTLPVTAIGDAAFAGRGYIVAVTIPEGVTTVGNYAFISCPQLASLTFPASVTSVGAQVAQGDGNLTNVVFLGPVTNMGTAAFNGCSNLRSLAFADGITQIGYAAFGGCTSLGRVSVPGSVTSLGSLAFQYCTSLSSVTLGEGIREIPYMAFDSCYVLGSVIIPASVTNLGSLAFNNCVGMAAARFRGNAPAVATDTFSGVPAIVYYIPGTAGWGGVYDYRPTAPWYLAQPLILNQGIDLGGPGSGFGLRVSWATNTSVVLEATTNLAASTWEPVRTNALINGTNTLSDANAKQFPRRFYRVRAE